VYETALDVRIKTSTGEPWILAIHRLPLLQKEKALCRCQENLKG
jgi:hypothetical protein